MVAMPLLFGSYRRFVILVVCLVEMIFMSGVQYGWNSLVPVWRSMGIFADGCNASAPAAGYESTPDPNATDGPSVLVAREAPAGTPCPSQNNWYSLAFIVASSWQFVVTMPCGVVFDRYRLRFSKLCNLFFFVSACLIMGLVSPRRSFLIFIGGLLFSMAGPFILFTNFQIGALFPQWQNLIVSVFSGGFDSSSVVFQLITFGYFGGVSLMASFFILGGAAGLTMFFIAFFLFPKKVITDGTAPPAAPAANGAAGQEDAEVVMLPDNNPTDGPENTETPPEPEEPQDTRSLCDCFRSRAYWLQVVWFSCILLRFNYFLAALQQHFTLRLPGQAEVVGRLQATLGFFLFCGLLFAPLAGLSTDTLRRRFTPTGHSPTVGATVKAIGVGQLACSTFALLLTVLTYASGEGVFYVVFLLEVLARAFLFSLNGAYFINVFPPRFFGKVFGSSFLLGGIFSFLQFGLVELDFGWSNAIVLVLVLVSYVQPLSLIIGPRACCREGSRLAV